GEVVLESGARTGFDPSSLRLDAAERMFVTTDRLGEALLSDAVRFALLKGVNAACDAVRLGERWVPLRWPAGQPPT
ncbi:MAG: hypothetical protein R3190_12255, partial [Thermoanaerobaculia bacterium]|nr:hypothetical protein [Thermoanaerobaculia bacterium]